MGGVTQDELDARRYRWLKANDNAYLLAEDVIDDAIEAEEEAEPRYTITAKGRAMLREAE